MEKAIKAYIIDNKTGESKEVYEGDKLRITREKSQEFLEKNEVWNPDENFIKVFPDELNKVATKLLGSDVVIIMKLMNKISYQSGLLTKTGKNDERYPLTQNDIIQITNYSKQTVIDSMDRLVKEKVYSRNKIGKSYQYFANPYIFFKGKYINKTLKAMFKTYRCE